MREPSSVNISSVEHTATAHRQDCTQSAPLFLDPREQRFCCLRFPSQLRCSKMSLPKRMKSRPPHFPQKQTRNNNPCKPVNVQLVQANAGLLVGWIVGRMALPNRVAL